MTFNSGEDIKDDDGFEDIDDDFEDFDEEFDDSWNPSPPKKETKK